jgi:hypothetical protein
VANNATELAHWTISIITATVTTTVTSAGVGSGRRSSVLGPGCRLLGRTWGSRWSTADTTTLLKSAATVSTEGAIGRCVSICVRGTSTFDTLLSTQQARKEVLLRDRSFTAFDSFNETVILLIKPVQNKTSKLAITKRLSNGG